MKLEYTITSLLFAAGLGLSLAAITPARADEVEITDGQVKIKGKNGDKVVVGNGKVVAKGASGSATVVADDEGDDEDEAPAGKVTTISGNAKKVKQACTAERSSFAISGNSNQVTLTGSCKKVVITGNANKVTLENVGVLMLTGNSNRAEYQAGLGGGEPKITRTGNANVAEKIAPEDD